MSERTFHELTKGCTDAEADQLAWHLAMMRARKTYEALRPRHGDDLEPPIHRQLGWDRP